MKSFLDDLQRQIQCSLCKGTMVEPKLLQCFHTFCKLCIKTNAQLDGQANIFKCPQCTSLTELKELDDVEDLQISPIHSRILQILSFIENKKICSVSASHCEALWQCLDCDRSLCDDCLKYHSEFIKDHKVVSLSEMTKEDVELMLRKESPCKTHASQDVEFHCKDCDELICLFCLRGQHHNHKTTSLQQFIDEQKDSLSKNLEEIEKMDNNEEEKKEQEQIALDIKRHGEKAQEQVKKLTKKLIKKLLEHEQTLVKEMQKSITKAVRNLRIIRHTPAAKEYIKYFIQNGTASDIMDIRSDVECSTMFTYNPFENDNGEMTFEPNEDLCEQVDTCSGLIRSFKRADSKNSSVNALDTIDFDATKKATVTMRIRTHKGELYDPPLDDVTPRITPENDVKIKEEHVTTDGQIEISCTPRVPGQLTAEVQIHGNPVSNSPLVMDVKPQHIKEINANSMLQNALNTGSKDYRGIAVNKSNTKIAVADLEESCVRVFTMDGDLLLTYGSQGNGQGQLDHPEGLAFLNESDLVIADSINHRICIVNTTSGTLVRTFGSHGNMNGQFSNPSGLHVDDDSNIIVFDCGNYRIQVFTKNGDYLYQFTIPGEQHPLTAVTHNGVFYVSACSVVHVIKTEDNHSPTSVTADGEPLRNPWGLAMNSDNNLVVCDYSSKKIYKFTLDGRYVGETDELKDSPCFIVVLNDGQVVYSTSSGVHFLR